MNDITKWRGIDKATVLAAILTHGGYPTYIVGDCVRDFYLSDGKDCCTPIELTTRALPLQIVAIAEKAGFNATYDNQAGHCMVRVADSDIKVVSFRKYGSKEYGNTIEEELRCRLFTIDAIAYDPIKKVVVDPYNGKEDIIYNLLDIIGEPCTRLRADYSRMFKALNLLASLNFKLSMKLRQAMLQVASTDNWIVQVSQEEIREEVHDCFKKAKMPSLMFGGMLEYGLLEQAFPEIESTFGYDQNDHHNYTLFFHLLFTINNVPKEYPLIRWAALFHDIGKPKSFKLENGKRTFYGHETMSCKIALKIMNRLGFNSVHKKYIAHLIDNHMLWIHEHSTLKSVKDVINKIGSAFVGDFMILKEADMAAHGIKNEADIKAKMEIFIDKIEAAMAPKIETIKNTLACSGQDVKEIGKFKEGRVVGDILKHLEDEVKLNSERNTKAHLTAKIKQLSNVIKVCGKCKHWRRDPGGLVSGNCSTTKVLSGFNCMGCHDFDLSVAYAYSHYPDRLP